MVEFSERARLGRGFVDAKFLRDGETENSRRFEQTRGDGPFRHLTAAEVALLEAGGNRSGDPSWRNVLVQDPFDPRVVRDSDFYGLVRLGPLQSGVLGFHDFKQPEGIYSSTIIASDIGARCSIVRCPFISNYIIRSRCILYRIDEMQTTDHSKFGNGVLKEGEDPSVLVVIDLMNEAGGRSVRPFAGMRAADAYLMAGDRADAALQRRWEDLTRKVCDPRRGWYGVVGHDSVIKGTRIIKDVNIGPCSYIKGANKLKNLSLLGTEESPVEIGEGVELVNGIVGEGSRIFYGCKGVRFVVGENCAIKYGARIIHSVLGDNSTVSCCEILNNLVFPGHEQHHNNSFLVASLVLGQSNMAAGSNIGSNHNTRRNDGELVAGRGFWPALSVTLKHNSRFASYTLLAKGNFPSELFVELPFSLVSDNPSRHRREIMPAYWWLYNMFALERNCAKYPKRDKRRAPKQSYENSYLAPDTSNEIRKGRFLLAIWAAKSFLKTVDLGDLAAKRRLEDIIGFSLGDMEQFRALQSAAPLNAWGHAPAAVHPTLLRLARLGDALLTTSRALMDGVPVYGDHIENSSCPVLILKSVEAYRAYRQMLVYYAIVESARWCRAKGAGFGELLARTLASPLVDRGEGRPGVYDRAQRTGQIFWLNLGGQLAPAVLVDALLDDVREGRLDSWDAVHQRYAVLARDYPEHKAYDACLALLSLLGRDDPDPALLEGAREEALQACLEMRRQVSATREKDYTNFFRSITYRNEAEQDAIIGRAADDAFIESFNRKSEEDLDLVASLRF